MHCYACADDTSLVALCSKSQLSGMVLLSAFSAWLSICGLCGLFLMCEVAVQVSQNYINRVTHIIAQSADEDTFKARQRKRDMIRRDSALLSINAKQTSPMLPLPTGEQLPPLTVQHL